MLVETVQGVGVEPTRLRHLLSRRHKAWWSTGCLNPSSRHMCVYQFRHPRVSVSLVQLVLHSRSRVRTCNFLIKSQALYQLRYPGKHGDGRNRTSDAQIFTLPLYQLSYIPLQLKTFHLLYRTAMEWLIPFSRIETSFVISKFPNKNRAISTSRLNTLLCLHLKPINLVIF